MNEQEILFHALTNIQKDGKIGAQWRESYRGGTTDGQLTLKLNSHKTVLYGTVKKELRTSHLAAFEKMAADNEGLIIIAQRIFPKIKEALRARGIAYLEANGNLYLDHQGIYICIDGNTPIAARDKSTNRAFTKTGLAVLYEFLVDPSLINRTYREIAEYVGTGIGNVSNIFNGLKQDHFLLALTRDEYQLADRRKLLDRWIAEYEMRLKPVLACGTYRFLREDDFYEWKSVPIEHGRTVWGGEPAGELLTHYLRPEELTLYTQEQPAELMKKYRMVPDTDGNIKVFKKFWKEREDLQGNVVHPILAYADLINKGDRRCTETAKKIFDEYLQDKF